MASRTLPTNVVHSQRGVGTVVGGDGTLKIWRGTHFGETHATNLEIYADGAIWCKTHNSYVDIHDTNLPFGEV